MSAGVQTISIAVIGLILAVILGSEVGTGFRIVPLSIAIAAIVFGVYKLFFKAIRVEALILGALIFGYIVGNRGFAQLSLAPHTPIYLGEVGMLACLLLLSFRTVLSREPLIPKTPLARAILVFVVLSAVRLYCDIFLGINSSDPVMAIRDSATVYYALFFFIAYRVGSNATGERLVERFVLAGCVLLLPVLLIQFVFAPDLFNRLTFRGYPIIFHKGDLTSTYLAFASFYFFLQPARGLLRVSLRALAILFFLGMFIVTARAAIVGYMAAVLLLLLARRPHFALAQLVIALAALVIAGILHLEAPNDQNQLYARVADKLESITDISGNRHYRSKIGDYAASDNEFRLVWWRTVFDETIQRGPIFGLGFGYDLTSRFMRSYFPTGGEDTASARSPHSIWMTIFGRIGLVGLISFASVVVLMIREAVTSARRVARGDADVSSLRFWIAATIILGSASFGVVMEGPMGGILFWSFLGLAASGMQKEKPTVRSLPAKEDAADKLVLAH